MNQPNTTNQTANQPTKQTHSQRKKERNKQKQSSIPNKGTVRKAKANQATNQTKPNQQ